MGDSKRQAVFDAIKGELEKELEAHTGSSVERAAIEHILLTLRFLPKRSLSNDGEIGPGSLIGLRSGTTESYVIVLPQVSPMVLRALGHPIRIVSQYSALAHALLGQRKGFLHQNSEVFEVL